MYDNPIVCAHIKPGAILWINCQVVTMNLHHNDDCDYSKDHEDVEENDTIHLNHDDDYDYAKDHNDSENENGTSFPRVLGSLLTKEARLMTEEGTIRT